MHYFDIKQITLEKHTGIVGIVHTVQVPEIYTYLLMKRLQKV